MMIFLSTQSFLLRRALWCLLAVQCSVYVDVCGQQESAYAAPVVSTPEATSITKFGDFPVDYSTGVPDISIPIYTLVNKDIEVPVSLRYHASGIKVRDIASTVGLGWALSAGGAITKVINGRPDRGSNTGFTSAESVIDFASNQNADHLEWIYKSTEHDLDYFTFSFLGNTGRLFFADEKLYAIPAQPLQFSLKDRSIQVLAEDGTVYKFDVVESQKVENSCGNGNWWTVDDQPDMTFYLSKIISVTGRTVSFIYQDYSYSYYTDVEESRVHTQNFPYSNGAPGAPAPDYFPDPIKSTCWSKINIIEGKALRKIISDDGQEINFLYSTSPRADLPQGNNLGVLEKIIVKFESSTVKEFNLTHDYLFCHFPPNLPQPLPGNFIEHGHVGTNRLLFTSIEEGGKSPYLFRYELQFKPSRFSMGIDHWGYYNGKESNVTLIPRGDTDRKGFFMDGGDRDGSESHMKAFLLKEVVYPHGGSTKFAFEANKVLKQLPSGNTDYPTAIVEHPVVTASGNQTVIQNIEIPAKSKNVTVYYWTNCPEPNTEMFAIVENEPFSSVIITWDDQSVRLTGSGSNLAASATQLAAGKTYRVEIITSGNVPGSGVRPTEPVKTNVRLVWDEQISASDQETNSYDYIIGGLRIHSILNDANHTGSNTNLQRPSTETRYNYIPFEVLNYFQYDFLFNDRKFVALGGGGAGPTINVYDYDFMKRSSRSLIPISPIKYQTVIEYKYNNELQIIDENNSLFEDGESVEAKPTLNGKTEYHYAASEDQIHYSNIYPVVAVTYNSWIRNNLIEKKIYGSNGSHFFPIRSEQYVYKTETGDKNFYIDRPFGRNEFHYYGLKIIEKKRRIDTGGTLIYPPEYHFEIFKLHTDFLFLDKTVITDYEDGRSATTVKEYKHSPNSLLLVKEQIATSIDTVTRHYRRVGDINITSDNEAFLHMKARGMKSALIEQRVYSKSNGKNILIDGRLFNYGVHNSVPLLTSVAQWVSGTRFEVDIDWDDDIDEELLQPVPPSFESGYSNAVELSYDNNLNVSHRRTSQGQKTSYLYGYNGHLIVAEITDANPDECFYQGFEESGAVLPNDEASYPFSGRKVLHSNTYTIPLSFQGNSSLKMSYWYFQNNQWQFSGELPYNRHISVNGLYLDEIRVYPKNGRMTTYTHLPGIGIESICDPNNNVTRYRYDTITGDFIEERNHENKPVRRFTYNYYEHPNH